MGSNVRWGFLNGGKRGGEKAYLLLAIGPFNHCEPWGGSNET